MNKKKENSGESIFRTKKNFNKKITWAQANFHQTNKNEKTIQQSFIEVSWSLKQRRQTVPVFADMH